MRNDREHTEWIHNTVNSRKGSGRTGLDREGHQEKGEMAAGPYLEKDKVNPSPDTRLKIALLLSLPS